jgi:hypothetical protein
MTSNRVVTHKWGQRWEEQVAFYKESETWNEEKGPFIWPSFI